jgi:hypothetical protein
MARLRNRCSCSRQPVASNASLFRIHPLSRVVHGAAALVDGEQRGSRDHVLEQKQKVVQLSARW